MSADTRSYGNILSAAEGFVGALGSTNVTRFAENLRHVAAGSDAMKALQEAVIARLPVSVRDQYAEEGPLSAELAGVSVSQVIPAAPGWRVYVLGPDEDAEACPVAGWLLSEEQLVPLARLHAQDGYLGVQPWAGRETRLIGLLAPGEEIDEGWVEAAAVLARALSEAEDG